MEEDVTAITHTPTDGRVTEYQELRYLDCLRAKAFSEDEGLSPDAQVPS